MILGDRRRAGAGGRLGAPARSGCSTSSAATWSRRVRRVPADVPPPRRRRLARPPRSARTRRRPIGRRHGDPDLLALGLCWRRDGCAIYCGRVARGAGPAGRVDGRRRGRRDLPGGLRQRLLHRDRGLPGDRRLRPGGGVDLGAAPLVRRAAGTGHVHRAVLDAPRAGDAVPRAPGRRRSRSSRARSSGTAWPTPWPRSASPSPSAATCSGCGASTTPPRRRTNGRASTATTPQPGLALLWLARGSARRRRGRRTPAAGGGRRPGRQVPTAPRRGRRPARGRGGGRGPRRRCRAGRLARQVGSVVAAGAGGVRVGRRRAGLRRPRRRAPLPAQGAPAVGARGLPVRGRPGCGC